MVLDFLNWHARTLEEQSIWSRTIDTTYVGRFNISADQIHTQAVLIVHIHPNPLITNVGLKLVRYGNNYDAIFYSCTSRASPGDF